MKLELESLNENLSLAVLNFEQKNGDILEKVLNENAHDLHTMLMKSDFESYLSSADVELNELEFSIQADLFDFKLYEKELSSINGNQTR